MVVLRQEAREMLAAAIAEEARSYVEAHRTVQDEAGRQLVTRNDHGRARRLQTGLGPIPLHPRRVHDRRERLEGERCRFRSRVLPPYLRRTEDLEDPIPWLYPKKASTRDMSEALTALPGPGAPSLSATGAARWKERWRPLRTTNPIESTFASVRLRPGKSKGAGSRNACLTMVFQLARSAERRQCKLNGARHPAGVIHGARFQDGIKAAA